MLVKLASRVELVVTEALTLVALAKLDTTLVLLEPVRLGMPHKLATMPVLLEGLALGVLLNKVLEPATMLVQDTLKLVLAVPPEESKPVGMQV